MNENGTGNWVWSPQPGSQVAFLACPVYEALYEGTRGPGKTDALIMDFAQDCGVGWGPEWRGILFRQTYKQLQDVIHKTKVWFPQIFPGITYNKAELIWTWPTGEELLLRYMNRPDDYDNYHGHGYPWMGWEELTNWPTKDCYVRMMACSRSTVVGMPTRVRGTTNPYGVGHNWVKTRFRLPQMRGQVIDDSYRDGRLEPPRVAIHGRLAENQILLRAEPNYIQKIAAAARNPAELAAWMEGDWEITSGGMFDDIWAADTHVVPAFPPDGVPRSWHLNRTFDWGSSKPFSVGWWGESSGEPFVFEGRRIGEVPGDLVRIAEWYGYTGERNVGVRMSAADIADGIVDREDDMGIKGRVKPGPADASIYDVENDVCIATDMKKQGVRFLPADKSPGSRKQGWEQVRKKMKGSVRPSTGEPRELPGLFISARCLQFLETVPSLARSDKDLDDVNTEAEDHIADEVRYRCRGKLRGEKDVTQRSF